jgi:hypothetical protein
MTIVDVLAKNAREYTNDVALVELNPEHASFTWVCVQMHLFCTVTKYRPVCPGTEVWVTLRSFKPHSALPMYVKRRKIKTVHGIIVCVHRAKCTFRTHKVNVNVITLVIDLMC